MYHERLRNYPCSRVLYEAFIKITAPQITRGILIDKLETSWLDGNSLDVVDLLPQIRMVGELPHSNRSMVLFADRSFSNKGRLSTARESILGVYMQPNSREGNWGIYAKVLVKERFQGFNRITGYFKVLHPFPNEDIISSINSEEGAIAENDEARR